MTFWLWIESLLCPTVFSLTFSILGSEIKVQNWGLFWTWGEQRCDVSIFSGVLRKRNLNLAKRIIFLRLRKKNACVEHAFSEMLSYDQLCVLWASPVAQMVKNPPAMWETWVQSLGWEDPLEEGEATHSSILAWRIPWTEEPGGLCMVHGVTESWTQLSDWACGIHVSYTVLESP